MITIEKVNDVDYKVIETIPETVIPAEVKERVVNLTESKLNLEQAQTELTRRTEAKAGDEKIFLDAMAKHDAYIAEQQAIVDGLSNEIIQAKAVGVTDEKVISEKVIA